MADPKIKKKRKKKKQDSDTGGSSGSPAGGGGYDAGSRSKSKKSASDDAGASPSPRGARPVKDIKDSSPDQKKEALDNVNDALQKARSLPKKVAKQVVSPMEALRRILVSASGGDAGNTGDSNEKENSSGDSGQKSTKDSGGPSVDSKEFSKAAADFNNAAATLNQNIKNMPEVADTLSKSPEKLKKEEIEKAIDSIEKDIEKARYIPAGAGPLTKLAYILREALRSMAGQGAAYEDKEYKKALEDYKSEFAKLKPLMDRSAPPDKSKTRNKSSGNDAGDSPPDNKARPLGNLKDASQSGKKEALDDVEDAIDKVKTLPEEDARELISPMEFLRRVLLSAVGQDAGGQDAGQDEESEDNQTKEQGESGEDDSISKDSKSQKPRPVTGPDPDDMDRRVAEYNDAVGRLNRKIDNMPEAASILAKDPGDMTQEDFQKAIGSVEKDIQKARYIPAGANLLVKLAYILREALRSMAGQGGAFEDIDYKKALDDYKKAYSDLKPLIDKHAPPDEGSDDTSPASTPTGGSSSDTPEQSRLSGSPSEPIGDLKNSSPEQRQQALDTVEGAIDRAEKLGGEKGKKIISLMEALRRILLSAQGKDFDDDQELEEAVDDFNDGLRQLDENQTANENESEDSANEAETTDENNDGNSDGNKDDVK